MYKQKIDNLIEAVNAKFSSGAIPKSMADEIILQIYEDATMVIDSVGKIAKQGMELSKTTDDKQKLQILNDIDREKSALSGLFNSLNNHSKDAGLPDKFADPKSLSDMVKISGEMTTEYANYAVVTLSKELDYKETGLDYHIGGDFEKQARALNEVAEGSRESISEAIDSKTMVRGERPTTKQLPKREYIVVQNLWSTIGRKEAEERTAKFKVKDAKTNVILEYETPAWYVEAENKYYISKEDYERDIASHGEFVGTLTPYAIPAKAPTKAGTYSKAAFQDVDKKSELARRGYSVRLPEKERREIIEKALKDGVPKNEILQTLSFKAQTSVGHSPLAPYHDTYQDDVDFTARTKVSIASIITNLSTRPKAISVPESKTKTATKTKDTSSRDDR